ncbi:tRNA adenosine(34) deaminase TadA [Nonomuraea sp. NPDC050663]|uniref:tRNA adenosine(34) deaminase TadA n=1 Tax=Nonomuraea sp. NPDC050663 TaxID=3364370 RepID=UPI0037B1573B
MTTPDRFDEAMRQALAQARLAADRGEIPIGAVVVSGEGVIGAAGNDREASHDPTGHAEILALRQAALATRSWRLTGCTLVVTLEPCTMCAGAAVQSRVDRIVYGAQDLKGGAVGSLWDVVRDRRLNHRPEVIAGILEDDCSVILKEFFALRRIR